jgi:hypothetical protein
VKRVPPILFHLRGESSKDDFFAEIFLLKLLLSLVMESLPSLLYKRSKRAIPTFGSSRAGTPINKLPFLLLLFIQRLVQRNKALLQRIDSGLRAIGEMQLGADQRIDAGGEQVTAHNPSACRTDGLHRADDLELFGSMLLMVVMIIRQVSKRAMLASEMKIVDRPFRVICAPAMVWGAI